jgi:histone-lysine N-methyltransferase SETMAR
MFARSRDEVIPRTEATISTQKVKLTIFFSGVKLASRNALPFGARFTQEYFFNRILPDIVNKMGQILQRVRRGDWFVYMNNFICHNGRKVSDELDSLKLDRVPHPPYSPDLSSCDFWSFGMLKQAIKNRVFHAVEEIVSAFHEVWSQVISEDLQSVFLNLIERFEYVIEHNWEYYINPH